MARILVFCLILGLTLQCKALNRETIGGLPLDTQYMKNRDILNKTIRTTNENVVSSNQIGNLSLSLECITDNLTYFEDTGDHNLTCDFSYTSDRDFLVNFYSDCTASINLIGEQSYNLPASPKLTTQPLNFHLQVGQIGDAYLIGRATVDGASTLVLGVRILVLRKSSVLDVIFRVGLITLLVLVTFFMGCEIDLSAMINCLKRPVGPLIGFFCQFCVMPAIATLLAKFAPINPAFAFGLFLSGCCPGGGASNVWTRLLGGDINLSIAMTLFSNIVAIGMMPLLIFAFSSFFTEINFAAVPYGKIVVNLLYLFVPVTAGVLVRRYRPSWADRLIRGTQPTSCIFLIFVIGFGTIVNFSVFRLMARYPLIIAVGAALPNLGYLTGMLAALICRRSWPVTVAIAVETGVQNVGVAILILLYAIPQPQGDLGVVMPIIISIATPPLLMIALAVRCGLQCRDKRRKGEEEHVLEDEEGMHDGSDSR